jgi:hypothetical protein
VWRKSTYKLHAEVDQLISYRVPPLLLPRSKPSVVDACNFAFNDIGPPTIAKSSVTISDPTMWTNDVTIACHARRGGAAPPPQGPQIVQTSVAARSTWHQENGGSQARSPLPTKSGHASRL